MWWNKITHLLLSKNKDLRDYTEKISPFIDLKNNGKPISELGERQQRRKLRELKTDVERTLWFAETYGLTLNKARFTDQNGVNHGISFSGDKEKKKFNDLLKEEQDKVKEILFIQDKFSIGDVAYHELNMTPVGEGLSRTYVMRQCKDALNDLSHIERTPGKAEGPLVNFRDELCSTIRKHVGTTEVIKQKIKQS